MLGGGPRAIETHYAGCRFRSRLEARWAVVLDAMGLRWQYEPEGFELDGGVRYLPDFYLPDREMWLEIKPEGAFGRCSEAWGKAVLLASALAGVGDWTTVGVLDGLTGNGWLFDGMCRVDFGNRDNYLDLPVGQSACRRFVWFQCPYCQSWQPADMVKDDPAITLALWCDCRTRVIPQALDDVLSHGLKARFEFGECGFPPGPERERR